jgi:hypothetical protein
MGLVFSSHDRDSVELAYWIRLCAVVT